MHLPEDALVLLDQIAIGHSRKIIANRTLQSLGLDSFRRHLSEAVRVGHIGVENISQEIARTLVHTRHFRMIVDVLV